MNWISYRQTAETVPYQCLHVRMSTRLRAVIDSGATSTVIPADVLRNVGAFKLIGRDVRCIGHDGTATLLPLFEADLTVEHPRWPDDVQSHFSDAVIIGAPTRDRDQPRLPGTAGGLDPAEPHALVGLDILAAWHLHLDGPNARYAVE